MFLIVIEVSFALLLQDDFSGAKILDDGHVFSINGKTICPLRKPEGLYVFTGLELPCTLRVDSARYSPANVYVDPSGFWEDRIQTVRLLRRGDIRFPDCRWLAGSGPPGREVYAFARPDPPLTLREAQGSGIVIEGFTTKRLSGLLFAVGEGKGRELLAIRRPLPGGSYELDSPLRGKHKQGAELLRAYRGVCDGRGRFSIPVGPDGLEGIQQAFTYDKEKGKWVCLSVTAPA